MPAGVGCGELVTRRQGCLRVGAGEGHRPGVAGGDVAIGIVGGDGEALGGARLDRSREAGDDERGRRGG